MPGELAVAVGLAAKRERGGWVVLEEDASVVREAEEEPKVALAGQPVLAEWEAPVVLRRAMATTSGASASVRRSRMMASP